MDEALLRTEVTEDIIIREVGIRQPGEAILTQRPSNLGGRRMAILIKWKRKELRAGSIKVGFCNMKCVLKSFIGQNGR